MNGNTLRLALVTNVTQCADAVARVAAKYGWQILPFVRQPLSTKWQGRLNVDVYLIDLEMADAVAKIAELRVNSPQTPVIALLRTEHMPKLPGALEAGAADFITFPTRSSQFSELITHTLQKSVQAPQDTPNMPPPNRSASQLPAQYLAAANRQPAKTRPTVPVPPPNVGQNGAVQNMRPSGQPPRPQTMASRKDVSALQRHGQRMIAVASLRGGVGRSTIALNLAVALRQQLSIDVTLAEMHHGISNLSPMLNLHPRRTLSNLTEMHDRMDEDVVLGHLEAHSSGIRVLSAPMDLGSLVEMPLETTQQILRLLPNTAACTIVDTSSATDEILSEVLLRADDVIVVTTPDLPGIRSALSMLHTLSSEEGVHARVQVVLNRADMRGGLDESVIRKQLPMPITVAVPDDSSLVTYAINRGVPFVASQPRAAISKRIDDLSDALYAAQPTTAEGKPKSQSGLRALLSR